MVALHTSSNTVYKSYLSIAASSEQMGARQLVSTMCTYSSKTSHPRWKLSASGLVEAPRVLSEKGMEAVADQRGVWGMDIGAVTGGAVWSRASQIFQVGELWGVRFYLECLRVRANTEWNMSGMGC